MPTKSQAKAAIDAAAVAAKADIDNIPPPGVNVLDGTIRFAPTRFEFTYGVTTIPDAIALRDTILANLTAAGRSFTVTSKLGRRVSPDPDPEHTVTIQTTLAIYRIINF